MSTTLDLVHALKAELKAAGITYAELAPQLGMAESSIKRIFAKGDMPLSRIDEICRVLKIDFADLARKAGALTHHEALSGWLYKSARYAAAQTLRGELRRKAREEKVIAMDSSASSSTEDPDWDRLRDDLDAVLDTLGEADRQAVVLRFYAAKPFGEIGAALRLSEDAARRRVDRALVRRRRGVLEKCLLLGREPELDPLGGFALAWNASRREKGRRLQPLALPRAHRIEKIDVGDALHRSSLPPPSSSTAAAST